MVWRKLENFPGGFFQGWRLWVGKNWAKKPIPYSLVEQERVLIKKYYFNVARLSLSATFFRCLSLCGGESQCRTCVNELYLNPLKKSRLDIVKKTSNILLQTFPDKLTFIQEHNIILDTLFQIRDGSKIRTLQLCGARNPFLQSTADLFVGEMCGAAVCVVDDDDLVQGEDEIEGEDVVEDGGDLASDVAYDYCFSGFETHNVVCVATRIDAGDDEGFWSRIHLGECGERDMILCYGFVTSQKLFCCQFGCHVL